MFFFVCHGGPVRLAMYYCSYYCIYFGHAGPYGPPVRWFWVTGPADQSPRCFDHPLCFVFLWCFIEDSIKIAYLCYFFQLIRLVFLEYLFSIVNSLTLFLIMFYYVSNPHFCFFFRIVCLPFMIDLIFDISVYIVFILFIPYFIRGQALLFSLMLFI